MQREGVGGILLSGNTILLHNYSDGQTRMALAKTGFQKR